MAHSLTLLAVFGVFIPALILPGPDFVAVVRASMTHGARAGILTTVGVTAGLIFYATLSLVGLSALLAQFQWLTVVVRIVGGAYLIVLGVRLIATRSAERAVAAGPAPPASRAVLFGLIVNLTNPKAVVLFASVFATTVSADTPIWMLALMIALVAASAFTWYVLVSLFMASPGVMRRFSRARHWIERTAGVCFVALGGKVLADARSPLST